MMTIKKGAAFFLTRNPNTRPICLAKCSPAHNLSTKFFGTFEKELQPEVRPPPPLPSTGIEK